MKDMLVGIHQSRSVNLTEVARSLKEEIELHASHKRLSRNLARSELIDVVGDCIDAWTDRNLFLMLVARAFRLCLLELVLGVLTYMCRVLRSF